MSLSFGASTNPRKWKYTWEAQSHIPTLRLLLFDSQTNPKSQCQNLNITLNPHQSHLIVSFFHRNEQQVFLKVPIPRVLLDIESPLSYKTMDDHIEVKLVLLLPVDHPIVSEFNSSCNEPLAMDSDIKDLSAKGCVDFYCRYCSTKLTSNPLSHFVEMPSTDWREAADNWFGNCCCSFGGISEKLVTRYANSYVCAKGTCLLNSTSIILCKDDLLGCRFPGRGRCRESDYERHGVGCDVVESTIVSGCNHERSVRQENQDKIEYDVDQKLRIMYINEESNADSVHCEINGIESKDETVSSISPVSDFSKNLESQHECYIETKHYMRDHGSTDCSCNVYETSPEKQGITDLSTDKKSLLNGFLENIFMVNSTHLSKDVEWIEFVCPQCSSVLGAYPSYNGYGPLDDGVRLLKCYISTCLPIGVSDDIFRNYTLETMFTNQLQESAKDELSFRTLVRDLRSRSPALQIILINPNSWCSSGYCLGTDTIMEPASQKNLHPIMKVLFSGFGDSPESQLRMIEDWVSDTQADEVYMLTEQIKAMTESLESAKDNFPPSFAYLQGLPVSHVRR